MMSCGCRTGRTLCCRREGGGGVTAERRAGWVASPPWFPHVPWRSDRALTGWRARPFFVFASVDYRWQFLPVVPVRCTAFKGRLRVRMDEGALMGHCRWVEPVQQTMSAAWMAAVVDVELAGDAPR